MTAGADKRIRSPLERWSPAARRGGEPMGGLIVTLDITLLLGVLIYLRLQRRTEARSRVDERTTVFIVMVFGILIAPTEFGKWIRSTLGSVISSVNGIHL
jgi:hypothetical protein